MSGADAGPGGGKPRGRQIVKFHCLRCEWTGTVIWGSSRRTCGRCKRRHVISTAQWVALLDAGGDTLESWKVDGRGRGRHR